MTHKEAKGRLRQLKYIAESIAKENKELMSSIPSQIENIDDEEKKIQFKNIFEQVNSLTEKEDIEGLKNLMDSLKNTL